MTNICLVADSGAASVGDGKDFFRSAEFLRAEKVSHSLVARDGDSELVLPLIVRDIPGGGQDATSPYGYPGGLLSGPPIDPARLDFSSTGLVSVFVRDRVGAPVLSGGALRNRIFIYDPTRPRTLRSDFRKKQRRNERRGYSTELVAGADAGPELRAAFRHIYTETMHRTEATARYFFDDAYLGGCLDAPNSCLITVRDPDGELCHAVLLVQSDGMVHTFLSGTSNAHLGESPAKNKVIRLLDLADEWGLPINNGGGLSAGDSLENFKESFTNGEERLVTHQIVCDPGRYDDLTRRHDHRAATDFFPAYRG